MGAWVGRQGRPVGAGVGPPGAGRRARAVTWERRAARGRRACRGGRPARERRGRGRRAGPGAGARAVTWERVWQAWAGGGRERRAPRRLAWARGLERAGGRAERSRRPGRRWSQAGGRSAVRGQPADTGPGPEPGRRRLARERARTRAVERSGHGDLGVGDRGPAAGRPYVDSRPTPSPVPNLVGGGSPRGRARTRARGAARSGRPSPVSEAAARPRGRAFSGPVRRGGAATAARSGSSRSGADGAAGRGPCLPRPAAHPVSAPCAIR